MGTVVYTAKRALVASHVVGTAYSIELNILNDTPPSRSRAVVKTAVRSLGGAMEVLRDYADTQWQITLGPIVGKDLPLLREFLDSTDGGETFLIDLTGNSSALKSMRRTDEGQSEDLFMARGSADADAFLVNISAIEI